MKNKSYARLPMYSLQIGRYFYQIYYLYRKWFSSTNSFTFKGTDYVNFLHPYNTTWRNERAIEIPIILDIVSDYEPEDILEVGNVLSHYGYSDHTIVDRYERGKNIIPSDILEYHPARSYKLIISISTIEHIGWDETPRKPEKYRQALEQLGSLLTPTGKLVVTMPLGYNQVLDYNLRRQRLRFDEIHYFLRTEPESWVVASWEDVKDARYNDKFRGASAFLLGIVYGSGRE